MVKTFTDVPVVHKILLVMIFLVIKSNALAGSYKGSHSGFSIAVTSSNGCTPTTVTISNISIEIMSKYSASLSFQTTYANTSTTYDYNDYYAEIINGQVVFEQSGHYIYCPPDNDARRGHLQPILRNITFNGGSSLSCSLEISENGSFSGSNNVDITTNFTSSFLPTLYIADGDITTVCAGSTIDITAYGDSPGSGILKADGIEIGTLTSDDYFSFSFSSSVSFSVPNIDNKSIKLELITIVPDAVDSKTLWVGTPLPATMIITSNKSLPLCSVEPILLSINNPPNSTVTWSDDGPTINNPENKDYQAIVQKTVNGLDVCPAVTKSISIQIFTFDPVISQPVATTKCQGDAIDLSVDPKGSGDFTFAWDNNGQAVGDSKTIQAKEGGIYNVTVTPKGTQCPAKKAQNPITLTFEIPIEDKEIVSSNPLNIICGTPGATSLDLTAQPAGLSYNWSGPGAGGSDQKITVTQGGHFEVTITKGSCTRKKGIDIADNNYDPNIGASPPAFCSNAPITLASNASDGSKYDYVWRREGIVTGGNSSTLKLGDQPGLFKYSVEVTAKGNACPSKVSQDVVIKTDIAIKNPRLTPDPAIICSKTNGLTLTALTDSTAGVTFSWSGGGKADPDPSKYIVSNAGTYTVTFQRGACTASASVSPKEEELVVNVIAPSQSDPIILCSGANNIPVKLRAISNLSSATIQWLLENGTQAPGNNKDTTYTPTQTGVYYAVANFNNICNATSSQKIKTELLNTFNVNITPNNPASICEDRTISLAASALDSRFSTQYLYRWIQDGTIVKEGTGDAGSTLTTGKDIIYQGNNLNSAGESSFEVYLEKDGCKATSQSSKISLKDARPGIHVLDFNTLQATESSDQKYQWYYKTNLASSLTDTAGYSILTDNTSQKIIGANVGSYIVRANRNECGVRFSYSYVVDKILATEPWLPQQWNIYPNPTLDAVTIEQTSQNTSPSLVTLWNNSGQMMLTKKLTKQIESYSLRHLPAGTYIMEIKQGNRKINKKIVKE